MLSNEDLVGSLLPNVNISRIILQSTPDSQSGQNSRNSDKLMSNVQFVLRETYTNDNVSSWLEDAEVLKYLKLFVIQSSDKQTTLDIVAYLQNNQNLQNIQTNEGIAQISNLFSNINLKVVDLYTLMNMRSQNDGGTLTISRLVEKGVAERIDRSDGSRIYNIFINLDFGPNLNMSIGRADGRVDENTSHLSYIFAATYNLTDLLGEIVGASEAEAFGVGNFVLEKVIDNGEVVSTITEYITEEGETWSGPIHTLNINNVLIFRSGQTENSKSINLNQIESFNYKVQDFREIHKSINSLQMSADNQQLQNFSNFETLDLEKKFVNDNDDNCFSNLYGAINSDGDASISFAIDFRKMFTKKSIHGLTLAANKTTQADSFINTLYKKATIESLTLKAKRIDIDSSLSNAKYGEEIVKQIIGSNIQDIQIPLIFSDIIEVEQQQIKFFSISDKRRLPGTYSYSVEIDYKDNVKEYLQTKINGLKNEKNIVETYYESLIKPGVFNDTTRRIVGLNPKDILDIALLWYGTTPEDRYRQVIEQRFDNNLPIYLKVLTELYQMDRTVVVNNFRRWLHWVHSTPEMVLSVVNLYNSLIEELSKTITSITSISNSLNEKNEGFATEEKTQSISKIITIKKVFSNTINFDKSYLYEYLDDTRQDNTGNNNNNVLSYDALKTDLIYKKIQASSELTIKNNLDEQYAAVSEDLQKILYNLSSLKIEKQANMATEPVRRAPSATAISAVEPNRRAQFDNFVVRNNLQISDILSLHPTLMGLISPTVNQSPQNLQLVINANNSKNISEKIRPNLASITQVQQSIYVTNLFDNTSFNVNNISHLPNQIKSLIKLKTENTDALINDSVVRFNYEMLKEVKVLTGFTYNPETKSFILDMPTWKVLQNLQLLNSENDNNKRFFCMLVDYNSSHIRYKFNRALREQCANEFFFINNLVNDNGQIRTTATNILAAAFEQRCLVEKIAFFGSQQQDNPNIAIQVGGQIINNSDSYSTLKYSYLSPYGIYFDKFYKVIKSLAQVGLTTAANRF